VGCNDFDAGNIHYEGHWKGSTLNLRLLGPERATSEAIDIWAQKSITYNIKRKAANLEMMPML
jgi:hypothetical protein